MREKRISLTKKEKKALVELLTFQALEKSIIKNLKIKKLGRLSRLIKKKWKKILPLLSEEHLVLEKETDSKELKKVNDLLLLYSRLYSDLIDEGALGRCNRCLIKIRSLNAIPRLKTEFALKIDRMLVPRVRSGRSKISVPKPSSYPEFPHLKPEVRKVLIKYFRKKLRDEEPLVMLDSTLKLRIDNFIRRQIDRIIDVSLEHGYKAIQYGYMARTSEVLSSYVERKGRETIDWTIENGVLVEELAKSLS